VKRTAGLAPAVLSAATFGSSGTLATSLLRAGWTPAAAVTVRVTIAALVLTIPALRQLRRAPTPGWRAGRSVAVFGLLAVAGCQLCYFNAVEHLSVAVALLLEYSGVLLVVVWLWLRRRQRPRRLTVAGACAALVGLALVLDLAGGHHLDLAGVLWGLGAAVGLAVYFVVSAGEGNALPPLVVAWGGLAVGAIALITAVSIGVLPYRAPRTGVVLAHTHVSWLVPALGLALIAGALAYVAGIAAARILGAKVASFVGLAEVLFAVGIAWGLLGQALTAVQGAGAVLVVTGIALVRLDEARGAPARPRPTGIDSGPCRSPRSTNTRSTTRTAAGAARPSS
jgi:drug/metabolite transporter (DMT)-like permease